MRLQSYVIEEKDALIEIQRAFQSGTASQLAVKQNDVRLLQLLTTYAQRQNLAWYFLVPCLLLALFQLTAVVGRHFHLWSLPSYPMHLIFLPVLFFQKRRYKIEASEWMLIKGQLESATLPTLLDIHQLKISPLSETVQAVLTKRLGAATTDELDLLTPTQRKELVRFTLAQVTPGKMQYYSVPPLRISQERNQAAIVGFLALATLKQTGAEHILPTMVSPRYSNLRRAIEEYQSAMKVS